MKILVCMKDPRQADIFCLAIEAFFLGTVAETTDSPASAFDLAGNPAGPELIVSDLFSESDLARIGANAKLRAALLGDLPFPESLAGRLRLLPLDAGVVNVLNSLRALYPQLPVSNEEHYCPVGIKSLLLNRGRFCADVFLKISERKFVKAIHSGEVFGSADFEKFSKKNISFLYLKSTDFQNLLQEWLNELREKTDNPAGYTVEQITTAFSSIHESVKGLLPVEGFTPEIRDLVLESTKMAVAAAERLPRVSELLKILEANRSPYISGHSSAVAFLACKLAVMMEWKNSSTFFKLALAAYLHDVTLESDDLAMINTKQALDESSLSEPERALVLSHPKTAAGLLRGEAEIPVDVSFIIEQHHEQADGSGFPKGITTEISVISALFILAHEIVEQMFREGAAFDLGKFFRKVSNEEKYGRGNSAKVFREIKDKVRKELQT